MFTNENLLLNGRYELIKKIGSNGSFGEIHQAFDTKKLNEMVVVKRLKVESFSEPHLGEAKELFKREAEVYRQLGSSNSQIPRLEAYFEENNNVYIVMKYIDGSTLSEKELNQGNKLAEKSVINLLKSILIILQFVHKEGFVHRDIKPDNIIRKNSDNKLVLIDFGNVRNYLNIKYKEQLTGLEKELGSEYAAPEQFEGEAYPRVDIYPVGIIGIQALTGILPCDLPLDPITKEILLENLLTSASKDLKRVIQKMVRHDTSERYQSADEVLKDLDEIAVDEVLKAPEKIAVHKVSKELDKRGKKFRRIAIPIILFFFIIMLIAWWGAYNSKESYAQEENVKLITPEEKEKLCQTSGQTQLGAIIKDPKIFKLEGLVYDGLIQGYPNAFKNRCRFVSTNSSVIIHVGLDMKKDICVAQGFTNIHADNLDDKDTLWKCIKSHP